MSAQLMASYSYKDKDDHLTSGEALKFYVEQRALENNALISMDDLECGHWKVKVYRTDKEKEEFLRDKWTKIRKHILERFQR